MARKILVVDDLAINRRILIKMLGEDYDILEAANGREALDILEHKKKEISIVLCDIVMPEMDGYEVLRRMRADSALAQIPVIIITGSEDEDARVKALNMGANDFIIKPYNPDIIRHCLRNNIALFETASAVNNMQRDRLTGLYNRETFFEKAAEKIKQQEPGHYIMSCFDVDGFKLINDQYGVEEGDRILREIGRVVKEEMDLLGGLAACVSADNFAALFPTEDKESSITKIVKTDRMAFSNKQAIVFSAGRYIITDLTLPASAVYDRAYIAKQSVKGRYDEHIAYFSESMLDKLVRNQQIISDMDDAIEERQFEVWFQPQYNHATGARIGAEALVRWRHPQHGLIPPDEFIPLFEQNAFVYEMDKYVWEETCRYLRKWMDEGRSPLPVSVNVSRHDIFCDDFVEVLIGLTEKYDIPVDFLRLEITESAFAESTKEIVKIVKELIDYGFTIEIDDFGSGYSSLNTLKNIPAQIVKLDMRFLEDDDDSQRGGNILESIVRMAKWLGMVVIAEGVEEIQQADFLKSIGCNYIQGYLYARPMPAEDYEAYCIYSDKEEHLHKLETVENLDNNSFWDPKSMDTLIFNSYVGAACIYEYHDGHIEMLRATDEYARIIGNAGTTVEDVLKLDWSKHLDKKSREALLKELEESIKTGEEITGEYLFLDFPGCPHETYLRSSMRVIARAGSRYLVYCISENITAQREAEQATRKTAKQLHDVMENVSCGITAVALVGEKITYLLTNNKYYELLGYTKEQYIAEIGDNAFATIYPEDRQWIAAAVKQVNSNGRPSQIEYRAVRRDGSVVWLRSYISMTDFEGVGSRVQLSTYTDITKAREAESQLKLLTDSIPGGLATYECAPDNIKITYFNEGFIRMFGYSRDEYESISADNPMSGVSEEETVLLLQQLEALRSEDRPIDCIYTVYTKNGERKRINVKATVSERHGDTMTVNAVLFDVTEQQEAMERLRISEEENRLATVHTGNTVCRYNISDKSLTVPSRVNPAFSLPDKLENVPYFSVENGDISPETAGAYISFYERILEGEESGTAIYQRKSKQGWRWIEAHFSTIFSGDGKPTSAVVSFTDVSEQIEKETIYKKWQQSLQSNNSEDFTLYRSNISKNTSADSTVGSLLHARFSAGNQTFDQRTAEFVEQCVFEDDKERYLAFLNSNTMLASYYRGKRIDKLEFREKLADGSTRWLRLTVELVEYPNSTDIEAYMMYENIDDSKRAEIRTIECAESDPLTGVLNRVAFKTRVGQLMQAADSNAQHALLMLDIDGFKMVNDVFGHVVGDQVLIEIADALRSALDEGDLISRLGGDEFLVFLNNVSDDKIVENKAKQLCALTRRAFSIEVEISGSVGIAMYKRDGDDLEELYKKADAALYHVKGSGKNNYAFYDDDMDDEHLELGDANASGSNKSKKMKRRMLIVDDNRIDHDIMTNIFTDEFIVEKARDGTSALIRLRHYGSAISVVLLDLMMPGMDGFAVLEKMQQNAELQKIPVIIVSGDDDYKTSLKAIRNGASDFVTKPVDPELLYIRVQSAISKTENERLRVKNSLLEYQNSEVMRYKTVLERSGVVVIEYDWIGDTFLYDSSVSEHIDGVYDDRKLWRIFLSDMVTDTLTVKKMQKFVHSLAEDKDREDGNITVTLKTPARERHEFLMVAYKIVNEYQLTDRMLLTFKDLEAK